MKMNLTSALRELSDACDGETLARRVLEATGEKIVELDTEHPHEGWQDRTGELHRSFRYEVDGTTLIEENTAEHASAVEELDGVSVFRAFDSGRATEMLRDAFREIDRDRLL